MTYTTEGRICVATIEGQTYRIPDVWLVGATHGGRTIGQAIALWHEQAKLHQEREDWLADQAAALTSHEREG